MASFTHHGGRAGAVTVHQPEPVAIGQRLIFAQPIPEHFTERELEPVGVGVTVGKFKSQCVVINFTVGIGITVGEYERQRVGVIVNFSQSVVVTLRLGQPKRQHLPERVSVRERVAFGLSIALAVCFIVAIGIGVTLGLSLGQRESKSQSERVRVSVGVGVTFFQRIGFAEPEPIGVSIPVPVALALSQQLSVEIGEQEPIGESIPIGQPEPVH